jgi:hypothetical protein
VHFSGLEFFGTLLETLSSRVSAIEDHLGRAALKLRIEMKQDKSLEGIISYLTRKHGGNVHEQGIVEMTSKSCDDRDGSGVASTVDIDFSGLFISKDAPGQWICWNFRDMRVRPTHYTIKAVGLKSWVVEGSVDGERWTEIGRQTDTPYFNNSDWRPVSFAVSNSAEVRLVRLTQTGVNHQKSSPNALRLGGVEFFGTLFE